MDNAEIQNESVSQTIDEQPSEFQNLKERLEEIADAVDNEDISLDEALDLYEEAVIIGLQAADLLDIGITAQEEAQARMLSEDSDELLEGTANSEVSEDLTDDEEIMSDLTEEPLSDVSHEDESAEEL